MVEDVTVGVVNLVLDAGSAVFVVEVCSVAAVVGMLVLRPGLLVDEPMVLVGECSQSPTEVGVLFVGRNVLCSGVVVVLVDVHSDISSDEVEFGLAVTVTVVRVLVDVAVTRVVEKTTELNVLIVILPSGLGAVGIDLVQSVVSGLVIVDADPEMALPIVSAGETVTVVISHAEVDETLDFETTPSSSRVLIPELVHLDRGGVSSVSALAPKTADQWI